MTHDIAREIEKDCWGSSDKDAQRPPLSGLLSRLREVATGKIQHTYAGLCPDGIEGPDVRDDECPACRVLMEADNELAR